MSVAPAIQPDVQHVLKIEGLRTYFYSRVKQAFIRSVDGVDLHIGRGETLGLVGESGSGKSVTALSVIGLVGAGPGVISGKIGFKSDEVQKNFLHDLDVYVSLKESGGRITEVRKDDAEWLRNMDRIMKNIRGREISMIFQNPKLSLNPFMTVGDQITEAVMLNTPVQDRAEAKERALHWLEAVKIDSPGLRYNNYPYGLSGGMCQRAMIAMALSSEPSLLIADEPTTGLDATIQSRIVDLLEELKHTVGVTTMLISHDIDVISRLSDNVAVMYGGTVLEYGPASSVLSRAQELKHPYTEALLESIPTEQHIRDKGSLKAIEGDVLDTIHVPEGCRFAPRCDRMTQVIRDRCEHEEPELLEVSGGHKLRCWLYAG